MNDLESLYRKYAPAVLRFAWGLSGDRTRAEDIVSETFVRLLTRAPRIETQTALAYLLAIARNIYLTGWHRRRREVPLPDEVLAPERDPARALTSQAELRGVVRALAGLSEGERAALLLRADSGLSYEDIAATLGISVGAAKVRVHRARVRLQRARENNGGNP
ncbi:MAG: RNA polymerase sigma factor [Acidobacteriota bacterium]